MEGNTRAGRAWEKYVYMYINTQYFAAHATISRSQVNGTHVWVSVAENVHCFYFSLSHSASTLLADNFMRIHKFNLMAENQMWTRRLNEKDVEKMHIQIKNIIMPMQAHGNGQKPSIERWLLWKWCCAAEIGRRKTATERTRKTRYIYWIMGRKCATSMLFIIISMHRHSR